MNAWSNDAKWMRDQMAQNESRPNGIKWVLDQPVQNECVTKRWKKEYMIKWRKNNAWPNGAKLVHGQHGAKWIRIQMVKNISVVICSYGNGYIQ